MFTREFVVGEDGLHSAVATALRRIANQVGEPVFVSRLSGEAVPVTSQLRVIGLGIRPFETVILIVNSPDASVADSVFKQASEAFALQSPR
ncbi:MAG: HPr family phosphocarrier protein [Micrococcales bacterium]